jgi:hypothetical protein
MIRERLTIRRTTTTKEDKANIRQSEDKVKVLTKEVEKVAVIRQEEVVQDLTTIPIRTTNKMTSIITSTIIVGTQTNI